jgi:hypothetical protein
LATGRSWTSRSRSRTGCAANKIWNSVGTGTRLGIVPTLGGLAVARRINDSGEIVGDYSPFDDPLSNSVFVWRPGQGATTVASRANVYDINNAAGWIVGYGENPARLDRAVLWRLNDAPVARIDGPTTGMKKKPLVFSATGSTDPDGDALTFSRSFGDGTPAAAGPSVTHEYGDWGRYTVTLTARDLHGMPSSVASVVTVAPPGQVKRR